MRYRVAGMEPLAIGLRLAADPSINTDKKPFPGGYGIDKYERGLPPPTHEQLRRKVSADIAKMTARAQASEDRDSEAMREIAIQRIEMAVSAIWARVGNGSQLHVGRLVELLDLQARMYGWLKSPAPVQVTLDQSVHIESPQPKWDAEYLTKFYEAMVETNAEPPEAIEAAGRVVAELIATQPPIEVTATETDD